MNRDHLNLNTFDPMPLALGERTTRLVEPVNPRAEFEAFERGDHVVPGEMIPLMRKRTPTFNVTIEASHINFDIEAFQQHVAQEILAAFRLDFKTLAAQAPRKVDHEPTFIDLRDAALKYRDKFGAESTREVVFKFGARKLADIPRERYVQVIAAFNDELGPDPDQDDGEGDTPDIAR